MKTFYCILYCVIRPNQDERVSIGLFFGNERECYFDFSTEKLQVIRELLSPDSFSLLKSNLKSIKQLSIECSSDVLQDKAVHASLSESYFNYLSVYSSNLLTYSKPISINLEVSKSVFNKLFEKFVFHLNSEVVPGRTKIELVRKRLATSIRPYVNFDVELTDKTIPGLAIPSKVAFIGKNSVEVAGELNDFSKASHFLKQQISSHLYLVEHLKKASKNAKFFYIGDEPSKSLKENHELWKIVSNLNTLELISTNDVEKVEEYMSKHNVIPLIEK